MLGLPNHLQDDALPQSAFTNSKRLAATGARAPPARARPAGSSRTRTGSSPTRAASASAGSAAERVERASELVGPELGPGQVQQRAGAAPDRHGVVDRRRLEGLERARDLFAHGLELRLAGRVRAQVPLGQHRRADRDRLARSRRGPPRAPDRDLGGPAAHVDHGERAAAPDRAGRAAERQARLVLAPSGPRAASRRSLLDRGHQLARVRGAADRGRRDRADPLGAELARQFGLLGDDRGCLLELVGRDSAVAAEAAADQRERRAR